MPSLADSPTNPVYIFIFRWTMMEELIRLLDALRSDFDVLHNAFRPFSLPDVTISICKDLLYHNNAFKVFNQHGE